MSVGRPLAVIVAFTFTTTAFAREPARDWRRTALRARTPDGEIVRLDVDGDGRPDVLERWWNGRRVRWLDENGDMSPTDTRGDMVGDALQVDIDGDGRYDGPGDMNVKWADNDGDGQADVQAFAMSRPEGPIVPGHGAHWMLFFDVDKDGVLGWVDWETFTFDNWDYTGRHTWLPDYNGESVFLKIHADPRAIENLSLNWENPFSFYDPDHDGATEMAIRWLDPHNTRDGRTRLTGRLTEAYATLDLDNDAAKDNETDFDLSMRVSGGPGIAYRDFRHPLPSLAGPARFDALFASNRWRRVDSVSYMPHDKGWRYLFDRGWKSRSIVFDEDDDDHRWERVELYYPTHGRRGGEGAVDTHSTQRWARDTWVKEGRVAGGEKPGVSGHPQADSLGDRGEFDRDDSGRGRLYVGVFDRKLHLAGAEWGAWTVDKEGRYHGGWGAPSPADRAPGVAEVVVYRDTDANGFLDTVEYDYDGDRKTDFVVSLLDYKSEAQPHPDVAPLIDTQAAEWRGLHEAFSGAANASWREALAVYRAAWRRGLSTPELDRLANAATVAQRYEHAYWIKEKVFRRLRETLAEARAAGPEAAAAMDALRDRLTRNYYLGRFEDYVADIAKVPGKT
jgi:hypothetical protein